MFAGKNEIWISADRRSKMVYDPATGRLNFYVDDTLVAYMTSSGITKVVATSKRLNIPALHGKAGATAGWVITGSTNLPLATLPASQTSSTLVVPLVGLEVGDVLASVEVHGQVDSAGNAVTVAATVRKVKSDAAGGHTDSEVVASANIANAVTADTLIDATLTPAGTVTVADDETYYVLLTGTTLGTTDVEISNFVANVTRPTL